MVALHQNSLTRTQDRQLPPGGAGRQPHVHLSPELGSELQGLGFRGLGVRVLGFWGFVLVGFGFRGLGVGGLV